MFNAHNISVMSWRSDLLVEETGVPGENHWLVACYWQIVSHDKSGTPRYERINTHNDGCLTPSEQDFQLALMTKISYI